MTGLSDELRRLAQAHGVATGYHGADGHWREASPDTVHAVLGELGVEGDAGAQGPVEPGGGSPIPPAAVAQHGRPDSFAVPLRSAVDAGEAVLLLEDGTERPLESADPGVTRIALPPDLPLGYHRLRVTIDGAGHDSLVAVAPERCPVPEGLTPIWGWMLQLYALRSATSWGIGDLADLRTLATWSAREHGAAFVQLNPLHATTPVPPIQPSPYYPASRRFANPLYLRVEEVGELTAADPAVRERIAGLAAAMKAGNRAERIDRDAVWAAKREALELAFAVDVGPERATALTRFREREGQALEDFATYCALAERHGAGWMNWPAELQRPDGPAVQRARRELAERVGFHAWLQLCCDEQLAGAQAAARDAGMPIGLIHDLAVGVDAGGADGWRLQDELALGASVGAPPDPFNQQGQDWGLPPLRPDRLVETGFAPFRGMLRAVLRHAGGLRMDHVMGLFRLWWIPRDHPPTEGTYVRYPGQDLLAIVALEAHRAGALVVGEDLGVVEDEVREAMSAVRAFGSRVVWFEWEGDRRRPPERYTRDAIASVSTHDLPTAAGWWADEELRVQDDLGLFGEGIDVESERARKDRERSALRGQLRDEGLVGEDPSPEELIEATHGLLGRTASLLAAVSPGDAVGDIRQPNMPGTTDEYPNWRLPIADADGNPLLLEELVDDERVRRTIAAVRQGREGARSR